ncbi:UDP-3-O-[3-hydroxymyristoyl] glucosamine N-acyltransferase [Catalinimonas alkaloidigena]|uniref:UDP-3-O-acylglucosamine N-acyltransferase n=1 Tax=Catalinimonas alkaloidigena TaxID=1075417 RepID=A0A1G9N6I1_9BACT|nr:UDP-3-O-(3-hydroxymyristoyl)glucosamine N-acyltransferase [Catalinimonas alkaloidigena]SDL82088.1 UDP-3-O-[3-hydroxymyristoyl] glucosamine N-acyltransferase [Catalinimonas alkaloidigena]
MELTTKQIADLLGGTVEGDAEARIRTVGKIQEAQEGAIAFLANPKYEPYLYDTHASAVLVRQDLKLRQAPPTTLIRVDDPYSSFTTLLEEYQRLVGLQKQGIEQPSFIGENSTYGDGLYCGAFAYIGQHVRIGRHVKIYPHVYIGDRVTIGDHTILYAGVRVCQDVVIGNHCTVQPGAIIGSDGFGFAPQADGSYRAIPQVGNVVLEDHVDIGANTVIDRATMGSTLIRRGVKLDNLIQVAHNVEIGEHTVTAAQSGFSGSSKVGARSVIGGQVGLAGHLTLAAGTKIGAQSGISKSIEEENTAVMGSPAFALKPYLKASALFRKLPELLQRIENLEEKLLNLPTSDGGSPA